MGENRIRVHSLAQLAGLSSRDILNSLKDMGEFAASSSAAVNLHVAEAVLHRMGQSEKVALLGASDSSKEGEPAIRTSSDVPRRLVQAARAQGNFQGAVPKPQNSSVQRAISALNSHIPASLDHAELLDEIGSCFISSRRSSQAGYHGCYLASIRFSGGIGEAFGLLQPVAVWYAPFEDFQSRAFVAGIEALRTSEDQATKEILLIHSPDPNLAVKIDRYNSEYTGEYHPTVIPFSPDRRPNHSIVSILREHLARRDPFFESNPVTGEKFFGRRPLINDLLQDIRQKKVVGLFGLRKSGKTSILKEVQRQVDSKDVVSILLDLERFSEPPVDDTGLIIARLRRRLITELGRKGHRVKELSDVGETPTIEEFCFGLENLLSRLKPKGVSVIFMLDEVEYLTPATVDVEEGDPESISRLLANLRSIAQELDNFTFILSGLTSAIIDRGRLYGRPNPLFSWAKPIYVGPLKRGEADLLAEMSGAQVGINFTPEALSRIHEATGGHAFLYRYLCSEVVKSLDVAEFHRAVQSRDVLRVLGSWSTLVHEKVDEMINHVERYYPTEAVLLDYLLNDRPSFDEICAEFPVEVKRLELLGLIEDVDGRIVPSAILELGRS